MVFQDSAMCSLTPEKEAGECIRRGEWGEISGGKAAWSEQIHLRAERRELIKVRNSSAQGRGEVPQCPAIKWEN